MALITRGLMSSSLAPCWIWISSAAAIEPLRRDFKAFKWGSIKFQIEFLRPISKFVLAIDRSSFHFSNKEIFSMDSGYFKATFDCVTQDKLILPAAFHNGSRISYLPAFKITSLGASLIITLLYVPLLWAFPKNTCKMYLIWHFEHTRKRNWLDYRMC